MKPINSFSEAKRCLAELYESIGAIREFMDKVETTISAVNELKGEKPSFIPATKQVANGVPESWVDRVLHIFNHSPNPLKQRDVARLYETLGWPKPAKGDLYQAISGSIAYMHKKKKLLDKTDKGYVLKRQ
jgi:hypothetical protein